MVAALFVSGTPACSGTVPGASFTCTGATVSSAAPVGPAVFTASGQDRAGNPATSAPASVVLREPSTAAPTITFGSVTPNPAKEGDTLTITFSANQTLASCSASVGGQAADCPAPSETSCACTFLVGLSVPEGSASVSVTGTAIGTGFASAAVQIDKTAPVVNGALVSIVRHALGMNDGVSASAGAAVEAGISYFGRTVTAVRLWDAPSAGAVPLATVAPLPSGGFAEIELPSTDGLSPGTLAPPELWASAVDVPGNESARFLVQGGRDVAGPDGRGSDLVIHRRSLAEQDGIEGAAVAFHDAVSALTTVRIYSEATGGSPLASAALNANGSFQEILIGTATSSLARMWAEAVDKCGNVGPRAEALVGKDTAGPVGNSARLVIVRRGFGTQDGVRGDADAFSDAVSRLKTIRVYDSATDGTPLGSFPARADGGFDEFLVGTASAAPAQVWAEAEDKCGLVGSRAAAVAGAATGPLSGDGAKLAIVRRNLTQPDGIRGDVGAFPNPCAQKVRIWSSASGGSLLGETDGASDSGFAELLVGDASSSYRQLWTEAQDKCGRLSTRVEALVGKDVAGPVIDGLKLTWIDRRGGSQDGLSGEAGAVSDTVSAIREARIYDAATGGNPIGPAFVPEPSGGFAEQPAGNTSAPRVYVEATDKAGNVSFRAYARTVQATLNLAGRVPRSRTPTPVTFYSFEADIDPRAAWPGLGAVLGDEAATSVSDGASAVDGARASLSAGPETTNSDANWAPMSPASKPSARYGHAMAYDTTRGKLVLFGGSDGSFNCDGSGSYICNGTWEYDGASWAPMSPASKPSRRFDHAMVYDPTRGKVVLFGGNNDSGGCDDAHLCIGTWEYDGASWNPVSLASEYDGASGNPARPASKPSGRWGHSMAYDAARGKVVLFGGTQDSSNCDGGGSYLCNGTWEFDGVRWTQVSPASKPSARWGHAMAYDATRGKVVLFGGNSKEGGSQVSGSCDGGESNYCSGTWEYDGASWTQVSPANQPSVRYGHAMAYDAARGEAVLFGGYGASNCDGSGYTVCNGTWEYDGANWNSVSLANKPTRRHEHAMAYDAAQGRVVLFGGTDNSGNCEGSGDGHCGGTWEYTARTPHARWAAHALLFPIDPQAAVSALSATYVGAGAGDSGGSSAPGVELLIWRWATGSWVSLGSHTALDSAAAAARTIAASPPGPPGDYLRAGRIWLLAAPLYPSSAPPGTIRSELLTDFVELQIAYAIP